MNATLNISHKNIFPEEDPRFVAKILAELGVDSNITTGLSVYGGSIEPSLSVDLYSVRTPQVERVFLTIKAYLGINCAHLETSDGYSGCIYKWQHGPTGTCTADL